MRLGVDVAVCKRCVDMWHESVCGCSGNLYLWVGLLVIGVNVLHSVL